MAAMWDKTKKSSKGKTSSGDVAPDIITPENLLQNYFTESFTLSSGSPATVKINKLDFEGVSEKLIKNPLGLIMNIYSSGDDFPGSFIFPDNFSNRTLEFYTKTVSAKTGSVSKDERVTALIRLLDKLPRLFAVEGDETSWEGEAVFPLFHNYNEKNIIPVLWKIAGYVPYEIEQEGLSCFCLLRKDFDDQTRKNLKISSFRKYILALLFSKKGVSENLEPEDSDIDATLITIQDSRRFDLGPFLFPRLINVAGQSIAANYTRLGVGPVFPAKGIAFTWDFTAAVGKSNYAFNLVFVFPQIGSDKKEMHFVKRLIIEAIAQMTKSLSRFCRIQTTGKKLTKSFEWTENHFAIEITLDNSIQKVPLWVYGKRSWVEFLTKLFHLDILWDIRARSSRTFLLTLLNFNDGRLKQRLSKEIEEGSKGTGSQLLHNLLFSIPGEDARNIIQFFLIGKLGIDAAQLQRHFYYAISDNSSEESPVITMRTVGGFHSSQILPWLPKLVQTEWKRRIVPQESLEDLKKLNQATLSSIFQAHLKDQLKLGYQARSLLNIQYLTQHNQRVNQRINFIKTSGKIEQLLDDLDRRELEQIVMSSPNKELAYAVFAAPKLLSSVRTGKKQAEDIEFFKGNVEKAIKQNVFDMEEVLHALEEVMNKMDEVITKRKEI